MRKTCPEHGDTAAIVEMDSAFYKRCSENNSGTIYGGHLVDVTTICNLECQYCYFDKGNHHKSVDAILAECDKADGPYILTGGEPTLHPDIFSIISAVKQKGSVTMLTNGYGLRKMEDMRRYVELLTDDNGVVQIGLSYHPEASWFPQVMQNILALGIKLQTLFFVIDDVQDLSAIKFASESTINSFVGVRIKIASKIWAEGKQAQIFASDVLKWFVANSYQMELNLVGKSTYHLFKADGVLYAVVNWYNVENVDLDDINTPPTYTTKDGITMDFVRAMLHNEGLNVTSGIKV